MRRTKEEAEKTRSAILTAAEHLFLNRGVAHTSLDQIARKAGVTRGAIYWHFQNKAHLFHEILNQIRLPPEELTACITRAIEEDPVTGLFILCRDVLASLQDERRMRIFTILLHRCEFTEELYEAEQRHHDFINLFIELSERLFAQDQGRLRPGISPRQAARTLHALLVGLFTDWTRDPEQYNPQEDAHALLSPLFDGLIRDWQEVPKNTVNSWIKQPETPPTE